MLFAQLVDDPSSHPELFTTEESQRVERERLHKIIERLVVWENVTDKRLLAEARAEITKSTGGTPPRIFDPFMGGGTIPLEAQRLGLEAQASDLNPVSVLITRSRELSDSLCRTPTGLSRPRGCRNGRVVWSPWTCCRRAGVRSMGAGRSPKAHWTPVSQGPKRRWADFL